MDIFDTKMTAIADEVRRLTGTEGSISLDDMANGLSSVEAGGGKPVLQDKTVTPTTNQQTITADVGYDGLDTVTVNAISTTTQATPIISVNTSTGLITATATQTAGYVTAGTKSATQQLAFQAAKTIIPTTTAQTAVPAGYYTSGAVTVAGDSNLVAGNIVNGKSIFGVIGTATTCESSGDTSIEDKLVSRTLTSYTNDRLTTIGSYAFAYCQNLTTISFPTCTRIDLGAFDNCRSLTTVNFPACTTIGNNAFANCGNLTTISFPVCTIINNGAFKYNRVLGMTTTVNFPACTTIGSNAFANCGNLTTISFPVCTIIGSFAFAYCQNLTTISFPACTTIDNNAFDRCSNLTTISFPACTIIGSFAFSSCRSLITANFPVCTSIGYSAFDRCSNLTTISFPACTTISNSAFTNCSNLTTISFPACTTISNFAFRYCSSLSQIYLTNSIVCSLRHSNAFSGAGITSTRGSIFVPASLVASYKAATNWAYYSNRIFGV